MRHTTFALAFALLCSTLALAAPRSANAQELHLEASITTEYPTDRSFDALSDDNVNGVGALKAAYSLDRYLAFDGLRAYLEVNTTGANQARFDNQFDFNWSRGMYLAGADWGPTFWGFIHPFVRVTGGYVRQRLQLTMTDTDGSFSQREHDFVTKNSVGLEVYVPYKSDDSSAQPGLSENFTLGLSGQFGYIWQTPAKFDKMAAGSNDAWSRSGIDLGRLESTGVFWDLGAFMRIKF